MKLFEDKRGFLGVASGPMPLEVAGLCLEVRAKLGDRADWLHQYLTLIVRRLGAIQQSELVTMGIAAFEKLFHMCHKLLEGGIPLEPFAHRAANLITRRPLAGDTASRAELYTLLLAGDYFPVAWAQASPALHQAGERAAPIGEVGRLRGLMVDLCGDDALYRLDQAVESAWQPVPPRQLFRQGYVSEMVGFFVAYEESGQGNNLPLLLDMLESEPKP